MERDRLLRTEEVSEWLSTPVATLRFWRHQGTGPKSLKPGRRVLYRQADVQEWLDRQGATAKESA